MVTQRSTNEVCSDFLHRREQRYLSCLNPTFRMETFPTEIWQENFAIACTDTGYTGRSLSLVSRYFHDISSPFKYQSLAMTQWHQIIIFLQTFPQLPDSQKKIKYLFIHCLIEYPSEEEANLGNAFIDNALEAFRAMLTETSSTMTILAVHWTSLTPLQMRRLLPPLPCLRELHVYHFPYKEEPPPTTALFPLLRFLYITGDEPRYKFMDDFALLAPKLTHIRFYDIFPFRLSAEPEDPIHPFNLYMGDIIAQKWDLGASWRDKEAIKNQFGTSTQIAFEDLDQTLEPLDWQRWWASRIAGEIGPWRASGITINHQ